MAFNDDFQKLRRQRLRDRFFDSDFDKERDMFFNSSPSFQSFFNRRGDGFAKAGRPQSQPNMRKMWGAEEEDNHPSNAKVRYIPIHHEWSPEPGKTTSPQDTHMESPRSSIHSTPHTSPRSGTPPIQSDFSDRSDMPSPSSSQQTAKKSREFIIPIKVLDKDEPVEASNLPRSQPHRGHSLNDESRRLNINRFNLDEGRPHSTPNSPHIWPKTRHASGPVYSQIYEPRKMEATVEREAPNRSDSKEYIIPVRRASDNEDDSHPPVSVQKLKAQFESPPPQSYSRPQWPTSESQPKMPSRTEKAKVEAQQVHTIPIIRETSPINEQERCESPLPPRQPTPPQEGHLPKPPEPPRAPTPEFMKNMNAMEKIQAIEADVRQMEDSINNFTGKKTDKQYLYLDEMLTRHLIRLDVIETDGNPEIRQARKGMVQLINALLSNLESNVMHNTSVFEGHQEINNQGCQQSTPILEASHEHVHKSDPNTHISHIEINPAPYVDTSHSSHIDVNNENTENHISRVDVNMDNENGSNGQNLFTQNKSAQVGQSGNSCNSAGSLGIEPGHMLSTSV